MTENRVATVLDLLRQTIALPKWTKSQNAPFETLAVTIISQTKTDRNTAGAFEKLSNSFEISPDALSKAEFGQIESGIKPPGLLKSKNKKMKQAANTILEKYYGTLQPILSLPLEEARKTHMQFQGVAPKTAFVLFLFSANQLTIPVDTHVNPGAKRLGFAPEKGNYETLQISLQSFIDPSNYLILHMMLVAFGERYCKVRHPLSGECPVNMYFPTKRKWE